MSTRLPRNDGEPFLAKLEQVIEEGDADLFLGKPGLPPCAGRANYRRSRRDPSGR